jgi:ferredoxin-NADP reductase
VGIEPSAPPIVGVPVERERVAPRLAWQIATVQAIQHETPRVKTITLRLPDWMRHRPGQHYDVRLTAPDGYQAQRSYSIASEPEREGEIDLTVEQAPDGEVSVYMCEVLVPGDLMEVRGPIGGYFVWEASMGGPLLLVAGGVGIVPLMSMLRHRAVVGAEVPVRLLYSARSLEDVVYYQELEQLARTSPTLEVYYTLTRKQPPGWQGYARRVDGPMLQEVTASFVGAAQGPATRVYVCGPTPFVEVAANALVDIGVPPEQVRTERFGPTGGSA